ncbi:MAG: response regulator transcription factor [Peptococcaceae bacterium]|jgi:DNA-binding response OmpR family regulator|nr:response regulator transcription factor [Peptococcaceae bacterium]
MSDRKPLILMVEDEKELARFNTRFLTRKGYEVLLAFNAAEARALAREHQPDLIDLDVILPDGDGFALCEEFCAASDAPMLFLTGKKGPEDEMAGFTAGGDYYMRKPYEREQLLAAIQSLLRRADMTRQKIAEVTEITRGTLTLQIPRGKVVTQNENKELSDEAIYQSVWGMDMRGDNGALRRHISLLKKKLGEETADDFSIVSFYGGGYAFTTK